MRTSERQPGPDVTVRAHRKSPQTDAAARAADAFPPGADAGASGASLQNHKKKTMKTIDFNIPADLYLGSDHASAQAQGHRHFSTTHAAIRFAMEQAAPVSLRGAMLVSGERWLTGDDIRALYSSDRRFRREAMPEVAALNAA